MEAKFSGRKLRAATVANSINCRLSLLSQKSPPNFTEVNATLYQNSEDAALVGLLSAGDQLALRELYHRHWPHLYRLAFAVLHDEEASKDIVQEIFVWLWEKRANLQITHTRAYLSAAVKFKLANYIRAGKVREQFYTALEHLSKEAIVPGPEAALEVAELNRIIAESVATLPAKCREIYLLSRQGALSNREIAERLNLSVKTVENQKTIALRRIRSAVDMHLVLLLALLLG